ncbi:hypothetical protein ABVT39_001884 [Epinephelus coioides]
MRKESLLSTLKDGENKEMDEDCNRRSALSVSTAAAYPPSQTTIRRLKWHTYLLFAAYPNSDEDINVIFLALRLEKLKRLDVPHKLAIVQSQQLQYEDWIQRHYMQSFCPAVERTIAIVAWTDTPDKAVGREGEYINERPVGAVLMRDRKCNGGKDRSPPGCLY